MWIIWFIEQSSTRSIPIMQKKADFCWSLIIETESENRFQEMIIRSDFRFLPIRFSIPGFRIDSDH